MVVEDEEGDEETDDVNGRKKSSSEWGDADGTVVSGTNRSRE